MLLPPPLLQLPLPLLRQTATINKIRVQYYVTNTNNTIRLPLLHYYYYTTATTTTTLLMPLPLELQQTWALTNHIMLFIKVLSVYVPPFFTYRSAVSPHAVCKRRNSAEMPISTTATPV